MTPGLFRRLNVVGASLIFHHNPTVNVKAVRGRLAMIRRRANRQFRTNAPKRTIGSLEVGAHARNIAMELRPPSIIRVDVDSI